MRKRISVLNSKSMLLASLAVAGVVMTSCKPGTTQTKKKAPPPLVVAEAARQETMVETIVTTGDVVATNTVTLASTMEGPITYCPWREGDRIKQAGEKLIEITRPIYREELKGAEAALASAKAKMADLKAGARPEEIAQAREAVRHLEECTSFAKTDMERIRTLVQNGSLPAETVEKARVDYTKCHSQLEAARERLAMLEAGPTSTEIGIAEAAVAEAAARCGLAQARLDECLITAPFAGVITEVHVRVGDLATPRQPLLKMMDESSLVVRAGLPEPAIMDIHTGSPAQVTIDAFAGKNFAAVIERIYPRLESQSRTRLVEFRLTDPVALLPRMFVRISVSGRRAENATVISSKAIVATPRGEKVIFVVQEGKAVLRKITTGIEEGDRVQILEGVKPGELVVVAGNLNLSHGVPVVVAPDKAATASGMKKAEADKAAAGGK